SGKYYSTTTSTLDDVAVANSSGVAIFANNGGTSTTVDFDYPLKPLFDGVFIFYQWGLLEYDGLPGGITGLTTGHLLVPSSGAAIHDDILLSTFSGIETFANQNVPRVPGGTPTFLPTLIQAPPHGLGSLNSFAPTNAVIGDMNGDGRPEVAFANDQ